MRRALSGLSGALVGLDYRNRMVLAAHEPVDGINLGVVVKIDIDEIREPFILAGLMAGGFSITIIFIGVMIFYRITNPILIKIANSERQFRRIFDNSEISIWNEDLSEVYKALNKLRLDGVTDLRQYLKNNEQVAPDIASLIKVLHVNSVTLKLFGVKQEDEFLNQIGNSFGHDANEVFIEELCAIWSGQKTFRSEAQFIRHDGKTIDAIISFQIPETEAGFQSVPVSIVDITDRKQVEEEVRTYAELFKQWKTSSFIGVIQSTASGDILDTNDAFLNMFGYSRQDLDSGNLDWTKLTPTEFLYLDEAALEEVDTKGFWTAFEKECIHKKGHRVPIIIGGSRYKADPDEFIVFVIDISKQKHLEEQIRRSQKMEAVGLLSGGIAHDFNNILGIVMGNLEILQDLVADNDKAQGRIKMAFKGAKRGAELTRKLLGFSSRVPQDMELTAINDSIRDMQELISKSLTLKINITHSLADHLWMTHLDAGDLQDAVLNLALNARDAMPEGGELIIETANKVLDESYVQQYPEGKVGDFVLLSVSDTGYGMTAEVRDKVLEPFFSTKEEGKGTGLGLSMVYGFVLRSGGHMNIYSEPGEGTIVRLYLPRAQEETKTTEAELKQTSFPRGKETILVVDDEEHLVDIAVAYLESLGYQTVAALNSSQALKALADNRDIDLLFSDVIMPGGMDGYELAIQATKNQPGLKTLLTSGFTKKREEYTNDDNAVYLRLSASLLSKPYNKIDFATAIRKALD
jgi:PAS domain S-box-containing protein